MTSASIDFETRSTIDLRRSGVYPYAEHPTTDVVCMCWAIGDEEPHVWTPRRHWGTLGITPERTGEALRRLVEHIKAGGELRAHNAQFERIMWRDVLGPRYGFPVPDFEQWHCTAAEAAAQALPRHLAEVSRVLNVPTPKDDEGHRLMLQMCKPRSVDEDGTIHWWDDEDPEKLRRLVEYCRQDVRAERAVAKRLRRLSDAERQVYLHDQRINDRGVRIDVDLVEASRKVVKRGLRDANNDIKRLTDGAVSAVTKVADLTKWLQDQGLDIDNVRKSTLRDLLDGDELEGVARQVVTLRKEGAKSSTSKLKAMDAARCADNRSRGLLLYHAASTGRWAGRLIQPQNFPRGTVKDAYDYIPAILAGEYDAITDPPLEVVSSILRGCLVPTAGCRFLSGDFSQIEARVLGWIANEPYGEKEYEKMAAAIYGVPVHEIVNPSERRQIGKNTVLGAGFGMGADKFQEQVWEQTGIQLEDTISKKAIDTFRTVKANIPVFWSDIESAAFQAVSRPGRVTHCGRDGLIRYVVRGQFLWCILPSGRPLAYALPDIRDRKTPWGEMRPAVTYCGVNSRTRKWCRMSTYGGHLTENVVQAMARDIMAEAMQRVEDAGYPVVLTVHDEVVADVPKDHGSLDDYLTLMRRVPSWAQGCPVEVEGWEGERYRK